MAVGSRPLVPSSLALGGSSPRGHAAARTPRHRVGGFIALTKPRIIELLLITTLPTMVLAANGLPSFRLALATLAGGALAAGGANAFNMVIDRDIDRVMPRTQGRPLVTGLVGPGEALVFATALEVAAFALLWWQVNLLSAALALAAMAFYVVVYTIWLKRTSTRNIVIGGAAGAVPVLVGWTAVTGSLAWTPVVLFLAIFLWTPPHFWALAIRYADDYRAAHVPMLPAVVPAEQVGRKMVAYTSALAVCTLVLTPVAGMGWIYTAAAVVLGVAFVGGCVGLVRDPTPKRSMRVFAFSISYVTILFTALAVDVLVRHGW
jgi:protoheme IX farnesyltransferase